MEAQPVRVVLADATVARRGIEALLAGGLAGVHLVAVVPVATLLFAAVRDHRPDVIVIDDGLLEHYARMPKPHATRLIVIGVDDEPGFRARAARAGAEDWVPKELADRLLPEAITRAEHR